MAILEQLGINHTYFFQLIIFVFTILVLSQFIFPDFVKTLRAREQQTKGNEELAIEIQKETSKMQSVFEEKAKKINNEIKTIFDSYRTQANKEVESIVAQARNESQKIIEETRQRVTVEINDAAKKIKELAPTLAEAMVGRLFTKTKATEK